MIYNLENVESFYNLLVRAQYGHKLNVGEKDVIKLFHTINTINSLDKYTSVLNGVSLVEYRIPAIFADLIVPSEIKFNAHYNARDYRSADYAKADLILESEMGAEVLPASEFNLLWQDVISAINNKFTYQTKDVFSQRQSTTVDKVDSRGYVYICEFEELRCGQESKFIPIKMEERFFNERYYSGCPDIMFKDYIGEAMCRIKAGSSSQV